MKKAIQQEINTKVESFINRFNSENHRVYDSVKQLRSSSAMVYTYDSYYVLQSYETIVAAIDRNTGIGYDFLRKVYGYKTTSAQHICKFFKDYGSGIWGSKMIYVWRDC